MEAQAVRLGIRWTLLHKKPCERCSSALELGLRSGIARWVGRFRSDPAAMAAIRMATSRFAVRTGDPLSALAKLLASGEFHLCGCGGKAQGGGGGISTPTPHLKPAAPPPRVQRTTAEPQEDQDSRSVLAPMMDPAAIADVQRRAAKLGVPFCEECLRGR